jgi:iron complex transport system ATP-binding protein
MNAGPSIFEKLVADNISLAYKPDGHNFVLKDLSLTAHRGQVLAIAGPNGSGKSTLLKALARQLKVSGGSVQIDGTDIWLLSESAFARKVAYVPQSMSLPDEMLVVDLVRLGRNPHQRWWSMTLGASEQQVMERAMERCGVHRLAKKKLGELSGGERQRAIIAMALTQEPHYILLDEPTANLDFRYQQELIAIIHELRDQNIGVVTVFHDLNLTAQVADQVALLARCTEEATRLLSLNSVANSFKAELIKEAFAVDLTVIEDSRLQRPVYLTGKITEPESEPEP